MEVVLIAISLFIVHTIFFKISNLTPTTALFQYPIEKIYAFFLLLSIVIVFILIKIKQKNLDNVGYAFLLLTTIKMAIAYVFLRPILNNGGQIQHTEKINFFITFMLFLAIETIITIRLVNEKL